MSPPKGPCEKVKYSAADKARDAARHLFWTTGVKAASTYWCRECRAYHITGRQGRRGSWVRFGRDTAKPRGLPK